MRRCSDKEGGGLTAPTVTLRHASAPGPTRGVREAVRCSAHGDCSGRKTGDHGGSLTGNEKRRATVALGQKVTLFIGVLAQKKDESWCTCVVDAAVVANQRAEVVSRGGAGLETTLAGTGLSGCTLSKRKLAQGCSSGST
jgi:uncharacterized protein with FMN-binding domain